MAAPLPRQGAPATHTNGTTIYNAWCVWCPQTAAGTFTELRAAGWSGDLRCCLKDRTLHLEGADIPPLPSVRVRTDPFPGWVADRDHWEEDRWRVVVPDGAQLRIVS